MARQPMNIDRLTFHTRKTLAGDYSGRVRVYHEGGHYDVRSEIRRLSRGDALQDARRLGHDLIVENFVEQEGR